VAEDTTPVQPKSQRKRKTIISDAGRPLHPPKKLREDHEASTGPSVAGKSMSALQRLLAEAESFAKASIPLMTVATTVTSTVDPATTVKEKFVESS
ncbi:hypothetical protein Tco_0574619, partial [Tanacetum coccineum]